VIEFINATRGGVKPQSRSVEISSFVGCERAVAREFHACRPPLLRLTSRFAPLKLCLGLARAG
jgi:hypothetical protein